MLEKDAEYEFRVVCGWHAGAALSISPGVSLGLGPEQDGEAELLLSDLPADASGQLHCSSDGWSWACQGQTLELKLGEGLRLGEVVVVIDSVTRPWPDPERMPVRDGLGAVTAAVTDGQPEAPAPDRDATVAATAATSTPPSDTADEAVTTTVSAPAIRQRKRTRWLTFSLALVGVVLSVTVLAKQLIDWATPPMPPPPAAPPQLDPAELRALVAELTIAARLTVVPGSNGASPALEGVVASEEEVERLMNALSRLPQRPLLRILTEADFVAQARALIESFEPALQLGTPALGALTIEGVASSDEAVTHLIARLQQSLPAGVDISDRSLRQDAVTEQVMQMMVARALPPFTLEWANGQLKLDGRLEEQHVPVWEQALMDFNEAFDGKVKFLASVEMPSPGAFLRQQVRTVISGSPPYLILRNGQKLMTGGRIGNYRLLEIRDSLLVWEWIGGRSFAIER